MGADVARPTGHQPPSHAQVLPVSRSYASTYLARVRSTTSSGSGGGGSPEWRSQPRRGRGQPVADVLLVERRLGAARLPSVRRPEARRVGGEHLVGEDDGAVRAAPELDLGVGEDDAALAGDLLAAGVDGQREPAQRRRRCRRRRVTSTWLKSTFSSCSPKAALVAGVKIGSGSREPSTSPGGSATPHTSPLRGVVDEPGAGEIPARDALDREHRRAARRPSHVPRTASGTSVDTTWLRQQVGELLEPPQRQRGEDRALVGDRASAGRSRTREIRSLATTSSSRWPSSEGVEVTDLAGVDVLPAGEVDHGHGRPLTGSRLALGRSQDRAGDVRRGVGVRPRHRRPPPTTTAATCDRAAPVKSSGSASSAVELGRGRERSRSSAGEPVEQVVASAPFSRIARATATACSLITSCAVSRPTPACDRGHQHLGRGEERQVAVELALDDGRERTELVEHREERLEQPVDGEERVRQRHPAHHRAGDVALVPLRPGQLARPWTRSRAARPRAR